MKQKPEWTGLEISVSPPEYSQKKIPWDKRVHHVSHIERTGVEIRYWEGNSAIYILEQCPRNTVPDSPRQRRELGRTDAATLERDGDQGESRTLLASMGGG